MNQKFVNFVVLALLSGVALAASVPHQFQSGTPASAQEVNANFQALADAVTSLEARMNAVEGGDPSLTAADVPGTYRLATIATGNGSLASTKKVEVVSESALGTLTLTAGGDFSGTVTNRKDKFSAKTQDCGNAAGSTDPALGPPNNHSHGYSASICNMDAAVFNNESSDEEGEGVSGTWALGGANIIVLSPEGDGGDGGTITIYYSKRGGIGFSVSAESSNNPGSPGRLHSLFLLLRQNAEPPAT